MTPSSAGVPPVIGAGPDLPPLRLAPGFWPSLRGVWLLTWRRQSAVRALGGSLLTLLALPLLAYLCASPPTRHPNVMRNPEGDFQNLCRTLTRHNLSLTAAQSNTLATVFKEEYARAGEAWSSAATLSSADVASAQLAALKDWNRHMVDRAEDVLTPDQFDRFQTFQKNALTFRTENAARVRWNASDAFYHLLVDFYFLLVLPLVCVRSCGALIRDELQADTMGFLTTRPAPRATLVIVKYISQTAWLAVLLLAQTGLLFAVGAARHVPDLAGVFWILLLAQLFAVPAWSALGLLFGLFTKRYIATALIYGFVVELGLGRIPSNVNALSLMRHLKTILANNALLRDRFELTDPALAFPIFALLFATALFLAASAFLFTFREYHHNAEMQK